jgi:sugar/nucleoside kinase (ribokinase family)
VAGFILGLTKNYEAAKCAKLGSTLSSFALEQEGAQPYQIGVPMVKERFKLSFPQEDVLF